MKDLLKLPIGTIKSAPFTCTRSGAQKEFYYFDFSDWVNVVALTPDRDLVMISQFRFGTRQEEIEIPGGLIEPGEGPIQAGCRELLEETGYSGNDPVVIGKVCPNPALQSNSCYTVFVSNAVQTAAPRLDDMEDISCFLQPFEAVEALVREGRITHGLVLNALYFYKESPFFS